MHFISDIFITILSIRIISIFLHRLLLLRYKGEIDSVYLIGNRNLFRLFSPHVCIRYILKSRFSSLHLKSLAGCLGTCNPQFGEAFTLPFPGVDDQVIYQLEVTLWWVYAPLVRHVSWNLNRWIARDQGGADKSTTNPANFLGEVLLNIGKLKPWDGIILEQVFELRQVHPLLRIFLGSFRKFWEIFKFQGHYNTAPRPTGQLFLKLKYQSEAVVPLTH